MLEKKVEGLVEKIESKIKDADNTLQSLYKHARNMRQGQRGERGETPRVGIDFEQPKDGHTPTPTELLEIIVPLISAPKDGQTPTKKELIKLIRPLIPTVDEIAQEVVPQVKVPTPEIPQVPKAEEILADVLAKLGDIQITINAVAGLEERLNKLDQNIRTVKQRKGGSTGGGGGMGNWANKSFTGDGSTTQYTLDSMVAGSGTGIIVLINGQMQELGTHFSVGSDRKTITFTTAPEENDAIFINYVRA